MTIDEAITQYKAFLSTRNMLVTQERMLILQAVFARTDHFSAEELLFFMQQDEQQVSRATLYRNLKLMTEAGLLTEADFGHGHTHYEIVEKGKPHEHLVCKNCGKITEAFSTELETCVDNLCKLHGFNLDNFQIQIHGLCKNCANKSKA